MSHKWREVGRPATLRCIQQKSLSSFSVFFAFLLSVVIVVHIYVCNIDVVAHVTFIPQSDVDGFTFHQVNKLFRKLHVTGFLHLHMGS